MKRWLLLTISILLFPTLVFAQFCTSDNRFTEEIFFSLNELETDGDVVYATNVDDWQGNAQDLVMDIYYPDTAIDPLTERPFILLIHGGGFKNGSKEALANHCLEFAQRGFVVATMQYRLGFNENSGSQIDPAYAIYRAQQDANSAMRFIVEHAVDYQIDTDWLFVGGSSAGSITALGLQYLSQSEWNLVFPTIEATLGSLNTSGNPYTHTFSIQGIFNNWGNVAGMFMQTSELIPMISFHGELDTTTPIDSTTTGRYGSRALHGILTANNVCSQLNVDPTGGHGIYTNSAGTVYRVSRASCFFKSQFCSNCTSESLNSWVDPDCSFAVSVKDLESVEGIYSSYPNPVTNKLTIEGDLQDCEIRILTATGSLVQSIRSNGNRQEVNVSGYSNGMYFIQIRNQRTGHFEILKTVKE